MAMDTTSIVSFWLGVGAHICSVVALGTAAWVENGSAESGLLEPCIIQTSDCESYAYDNVPPYINATRWFLIAGQTCMTHTLAMIKLQAQGKVHRGWAVFAVIMAASCYLIGCCVFTWSSPSTSDTGETISYGYSFKLAWASSILSLIAAICLPCKNGSYSEIP